MAKKKVARKKPLGKKSGTKKSTSSQSKSSSKSRATSRPKSGSKARPKKTHNASKSARPHLGSKRKVAKTKLDPRRFHVVIYGSARIKHGDPRYRMVYNLAKMVANEEMDVVTGGGPGLMNAASRGHYAGRKGNGAQSVGLTIRLPIEKRKAYHLNVKEEFHRFSGRLDTFMTLANVVVVAPGGIGTLLELFYTWQLVQVGHVCKTPIILLGKDYEELIDWMRRKVLSKKMVSKQDFDYIYNADTCSEAMTIIRETKAQFDSGELKCDNYDVYAKRQP